LDIEEAFREYREDMVRAMVFFSGDGEVAEDGVSHAFTQALVHRPMLEAMPEPAMKAWLFAAARNAIVDIKRREFRFVPIAARDGSEMDFPDLHQDDPAGRAVIEMLMEKLPESLRIPVELKYYRGMNSTEIGEAMNLNAATVRTKLRTAMQRMREE